MKVKLKESLSEKKTLLVLSLLSVFASLLCVVFSDIALPALVAILAALLCFDQSGRKVYAYTSLAWVLTISILGGFITGQFLVFWGVQAIILAWVISHYCVKGGSKMECAFICTLVYAVFIVLSLIIFAMIDTGKFTLEAVAKYYSNLIEQFRILFVDNMYNVFSTAYAGTELELTRETFTAMYDSLIGNIVSFIMIGGFVCCGIALKIFSFITKRYAEDKDYISKWRFATPSLYAYFYMILILLSLFTTSSADVFSVCISNLYNIFMIVYAYVGFNFAYEFLAKKRKPVFAFLLLIIITLMFFNFAIELLAMIGAFGTIRKNKEISA